MLLYVNIDLGLLKNEDLWWWLTLKNCNEILIPFQSVKNEWLIVKMFGNNLGNGPANLLSFNWNILFS